MIVLDDGSESCEIEGQNQKRKQTPQYNQGKVEKNCTERKL